MKREIKIRVVKKALRNGKIFNKIYKLREWRGSDPLWEGEGTYQIISIDEFTSLKDENGVDIYESDIVKTETDKPMVVTWSKKFASFCLNRDGWAFQHWFGEAVNPEKCKVIGNIHKNPELLKPLKN